MKAKRKLGVVDQEGIAFQYEQNLESIVRDLKAIEGLIPKEISRVIYVDKMPSMASLIIHKRKEDLLSYIQIICRDHIFWSEKLIEKGWSVEQWNRRRPRGSK